MGHTERLRNDFREKQNGRGKHDRKNPQCGRVENVGIGGAGDGRPDRMRNRVDDQDRCNWQVDTRLEPGKQFPGAFALTYE